MQRFGGIEFRHSVGDRSACGGLGVHIGWVLLHVEESKIVMEFSDYGFDFGDFWCLGQVDSKGVVNGGIRFDTNDDFFGLSFGDRVACERSEQDSNDCLEKEICCVHVAIVFSVLRLLIKRGHDNIVL